MTVPTGFAVSGSPITSAGTLAVTFASGYALPTTVKQSNWDDAYTFVSNFPSQTGNNGKFLYTSGSVLSWQTALQNPMTALGDMLFGGVSGAVTVLPGNQFTTRAYLQQVGTGSGSAAPTWGGIVSTDISGQAITRVNDTNVTLTLTGTPGNSVLNAVGLTLGWSGELSAGRGGTGTSGVSGIMLGNLTAPVTGITGIGGQLLRANPSTGVYEFFTPPYLSSPFTQLGQIIYSGAGGQPLALNANSTGNNMYLRSISSGTPAWASIQGGDIVGAGITKTDDTNVTITLGGTPSNSVLRNVTLTMGWTSELSVPRGGTGVNTMTGVVVGNGIGVMTGVVGTASQLLRRDATNSFYEFFTHNFLSNPMTTLGDIITANAAGAPLRLGANATSINKYLRSVNGSTPSWEELPASVSGSGTTNYVAKWASSTALGNSLIYDNGTNVGIGSALPITKLHINKASQTIGGTTPNGALVITDLSSSNFVLELGTDATKFPYIQSTNAISATYYSLLLNPSGGNVGIGVLSPVSELDVFGSINLRSGYNLTWGGVYGTDIPTISGTSGSGSNGILQFYPAGSTSGVKMALRRTGQLALPSYTSSSAFSGTSVATLAVDATGDVITIAPQQVTTSGTYTPTWTGLANVTSVTAFSCQYMRVGDTVTVSGWVTIDPVSDNTPTSLSFSLPINSDVSVVNRLNGTGVTQGGGAAASLSGYAVNFGEFEVIPSLATAVNYSFHFTYRIV
jgi:hypothetical protein